MTGVQTCALPIYTSRLAISLYLRGSFNGWGATSALDSQGSGLYMSSCSLSAGTKYEFKFGSSDWSLSYGYSSMSYDSARGGLDSSYFSEGSENSNIAFTPPSSGSYRFWYSPATASYWVMAQ